MSCNSPHGARGEEPSEEEPEAHRRASGPEVRAQSQGLDGSSGRPSTVLPLPAPSPVYC